MCPRCSLRLVLTALRGSLASVKHNQEKFSAMEPRSGGEALCGKVTSGKEG
jgi:hypothetical protein